MSKKTKYFMALVFTLQPVMLIADEAIVSLKLSGPGQYVVEIVVKADGTSTAVVLPLHDLTDSDPTDPTDPIPPLKGVAAQTKALTAVAYTKEAEHLTARALARLHTEVGKRWKDGRYTETQAIKGIEDGRSLIYENVSDDASWTEWNAGTDAIVTLERQAGTFTGDTYLAMVVGIMAATGEQGIFKGIDWDRLIKQGLEASK